MFILVVVGPCQNDVASVFVSVDGNTKGVELLLGAAHGGRICRRGLSDN